MKRRKTAKSKCKREAEVDEISNLPGNVIDQILSYLPIRDAVRTSLLSSQWRYKWAMLPSLVFDDQSLSLSSVSTDKLVRIIDHVLLLHDGPIRKFKLSYRKLQPTSDIDSWILKLSKTNIEQLVLKISKLEHYKIPSCLFSCQTLTHLELYNCSLRPPSVFKGFRNLKSLDLCNATLAQDVFENLISSCSMLERLTLKFLDGPKNLNIDAPNLQFLNFHGNCANVSLQNTFHLAVVNISISSDANYQEGALNESSNLLNFFTHLPRIERLDIDSFFLVYLALGVIPRELPNRCGNLHHLTICINFTYLEETSTVLCLLRSAPNLQELEIYSAWEEIFESDTNFWVAEDWNYAPFMQLRHLSIYELGGIEAEMDFIKFMLLISPVLEKMTVEIAQNACNNWDFDDDKGRFELAKKLLGFKRASPQSVITFLDP